ncbi:MAG: GFA family protein [Halofilum sp. (in: g-proteobacteria)]|nr:GFA family protein [Halofilum sp. (in: g-proteobacteria)]
MLSGGCLCGGVRYALEDTLGPIELCHCTQCRRASGSAFAANATVAACALRLVAGAGLVTEYESSPGKLRAFCGRCGSPLYARRPAAPAELRLRVGTLDDDPAARPSGHWHVATKAAWFTITDDLPQHPDEA